MSKFENSVNFTSLAPSIFFYKKLPTEMRSGVFDFLGKGTESKVGVWNEIFEDVKSNPINIAKWLKIKHLTIIAYKEPIDTIVNFLTKYTHQIDTIHQQVKKIENAKNIENQISKYKEILKQHDLKTEEHSYYKEKIQNLIQQLSFIANEQNYLRSISESEPEMIKLYHILKNDLDSVNRIIIVRTGTPEYVEGFNIESRYYPQHTYPWIFEFKILLEYYDYEYTSLGTILRLPYFEIHIEDHKYIQNLDSHFFKKLLNIQDIPNTKYNIDFTGSVLLDPSLDISKESFESKINLWIQNLKKIKNPMSWFMLHIPETGFVGESEYMEREIKNLEKLFQVPNFTKKFIIFINDNWIPLEWLKICVAMYYKYQKGIIHFKINFDILNEYTVILIHQLLDLVNELNVPFCITSRVEDFNRVHNNKSLQKEIQKLLDSKNLKCFYIQNELERSEEYIKSLKDFEKWNQKNAENIKQLKSFIVPEKYSILRVAKDVELWKIIKN